MNYADIVYNRFYRFITFAWYDFLEALHLWKRKELYEFHKGLLIDEILNHLMGKYQEYHQNYLVGLAEDSLEQCTINNLKRQIKDLRQFEKRMSEIKK